METRLDDEIKERIQRRGKITFAEFMEVALYHPAGGYYARATPSVEHRDYYTSPGAHPAFGALIAIQLRRMWELLRQPTLFYAIEMGAGRGLLARDVVSYARDALGPFGTALRYILLDRSAADFSSGNRPAPDERIISTGSPIKGVVGCFLSNELVDSFPVHRFQVDGDQVKEVYVTVANGRVEESLGEPSTPLLTAKIGTLGHSLPEGYRGEVNLQIAPWMREVSRALDRGFVLTIDYGYESAEPYAAERAGGTVQTYYRHSSGSSPYDRVGMQDITAHVDFSAIASAGEAAGLMTVGLMSQAAFLQGLGLDRLLRKLRTERLLQTERDANMMAMRQLASPDGLGSFRVLVQEKDTGIEDVAELMPQDETSGIADDPVLPLLRPEHLALMGGRYPHATWEPQALWPGGAGEP